MDNITSPSPRWGHSAPASVSDVEYVSDNERNDRQGARMDSPTVSNTRPTSADYKDLVGSPGDTQDTLTRRYGFKADDIMLQRPGPVRDSATIDSDSASSFQRGFDTPLHRDHVDVRAAEQAFERLSRQLSRASAAARRDGDPERQDADGDFDLLAYLQSVDSEASKAGLKRKKVHVVWKDLSVQGVASATLHLK